MLRASGEGRYVISREGRQFTALELADEPAYFREEILFAFEESILFENGRVPAKSGSDLHLVHLRGRASCSWSRTERRRPWTCTRASRCGSDGASWSDGTGR